MKRFFAAILALFMALQLSVIFCGCNDSLPVEPTSNPVVDPIDDNYRVFYEIFVGSFSDSNDDGIGDIKGIINRMDYLNDGDINSGKSLGVQGLWLSPIFSSPSYHKYDVGDYYDIDVNFGSEQDLVDLVSLCHERNVKVILDLPINHTSSSNAWFISFCNAHKEDDTDNPYYDYYSYATLDTRKGGHAYSQIPGCSDEYYECNFSTDMPELDFDNAAVRQLVVDIAAYYIDLGVDGFRFDAIKYIYYSDTVKSASFWDWYMDELVALKDDIYCVGECWSNDVETMNYIGSLNCFDFQMAQAEGFIASAAKGASMSVFTNYVEKYSAMVRDANPNGMMISFLSNHDMDRSAGYLPLATKRPYMAANLYLLCCGSPFIYYGEEIGMRGSRGADNTDANRRLAMLWGDGDSVSDPYGTTYSPDKQTNGTVRQQLENATSLCSYYGKVIRLRNKYPQIARGNYQAIAFNESCFGGFLVTYGDSTIGIFHNTSDRTLSIDLSQSLSIYDYSFTSLCDYIGQGAAVLEGTILTIDAQTSVILN